MDFLEKGRVLWFQSLFREFTLCYKIRIRLLGWVCHISLLICYPYSFINIEKICKYLNYANPRTAGGGQFDPRPCGFSKTVYSKERMKPWFFSAFNITLRHIFPKKFIEFPEVVQKIWTVSLSILAIFIHFPNFFDFLTLPCYKETNVVSLQQMT